MLSTEMNIILLFTCIIGVCAQWQNGQWGNEWNAISSKSRDNVQNDH